LGVEAIRKDKGIVFWCPVKLTCVPYEATQLGGCVKASSGGIFRGAYSSILPPGS